MIHDSNATRYIVTAQLQAIDAQYTKMLRDSFRKKPKPRKEPRIIPASEIPRGYIY